MSSEESREQVVPSDNINAVVSQSEIVDTKVIKAQEQQVTVEIIEETKTNGTNITTNNGDSEETSQSKTEVTVEETVKIATPAEIVTVTTTDTTTTVSETNKDNETKVF